MNAAKIILGDIIDKLHPHSVVDFGCGEGWWLHEAWLKDNNLRILGLDGATIEVQHLLIPQSCFLLCDLRQKQQLNERYDLAITLEVAEHIDADYSDNFVDSICDAADRILFSAAIPGQGGLHHVNEQWQSYWVEKFSNRGYRVDLSVRRHFWHNGNIVPYRRQNLLYFTSCNDNPLWEEDEEIIDVAHPGALETWVDLGAISNVFIKLDKVLTQCIENNTHVFIYPYGRNGRISKIILNEKHGIKEAGIVDNLCTENGVIRCEDLPKLKSNEIILNTCSNKSIYKEVLSEIKKFVNEEKIVNVFDG